MGAEQLIGTIEKVNTHDSDSREDPWQKASEQWAGLASTFKAHYQSLATEEHQADQADVADAFQTLGRAAQRVTDSVSHAMQDPVSREQMKQAAAALLTAIGRTLSELGKEFSGKDADDVDDPSAS